MARTVLTVTMWLHIVAGTLALISLWIPWLSRKGSSLHRRAGWLFVGAMAVVAVSALTPSGVRIWQGAGRPPPLSLFLSYIALLSAAGTSMGIRVIHTQRRTGAHRHPWDLGLPFLLILGGCALAGWAMQLERTLFALFGGFGALLGCTQLRFWLRPPRSKGQWVLEHIGSMGGSCIGAVTAFVVVNASKLGFDAGSLWAWMTPGVVGGILVGAISATYRRKLRRAQASSRTGPARHHGLSSSPDDFQTLVGRTGGLAP